MKYNIQTKTIEATPEEMRVFLNSLDKSVKKAATTKTHNAKKKVYTGGRKHMRWTQNEINVLKDQYKNGASVFLIAKALDRTKHAIESKLSVLRIEGEL